MMINSTNLSREMYTLLIVIEVISLLEMYRSQDSYIVWHTLLIVIELHRCYILYQ